MTPAEIKALTAPISEEEPCGPDLEMLGDADYMRFVARADGMLPKSFAAFDRGSIDFPAEYATLKSLLGRSRDLRLMTFLAKLLILNRDLAGFVAAAQTIEGMLDTLWERVHPELLDGDAILRIVSLQTLDDMPDAVMPLQSAPLFEERRFGKASYRSHLLATGVIQGRVAANDGEANEEVPSADALKTALAKTEMEQLVSSRDLTAELTRSLKRTEELVAQKSGQPSAVKFEKLAPLAQEIFVFLDGGVAARDPSLALSPTAGAEAGEQDGDAAPGKPSGPVRSLAEAQAALAAAASYFVKSEPSTPALMLIGQAEALIGRSFFDAMQALVPDLSAQANIRVGRDIVFRLPLERLASLSVTTAPEPESPDGDGYGDSSQEESSWGDDSSSDSYGDSGDSSEAGEEGASGGDGASGDAAENEAAEGSETESASEESASEESQSSVDDSDSSGAEDDDGSRNEAVRAPAHTPVVFRAVNRQEAVALLSQVATYFRSVEPSSPVPTLLDHAASLAGRDFFGLLRDVLPAAALRVDE